ncbi:hypothetical protein M23134_00388 [Microscilla marina ATCC 23134]|uniref:FeoB-associated Cys-rich membrane protein n=1 Tax=Microscilla marina ATCC 23134 TaxID=313606 RepID=A1ZIW8_MICM2|nr:hypothetical protein M23134_00388 [Microscilla marina ATCC 23134]
MQTLFVTLTFLVACIYLGKQLYQTFWGKDEHCESCSMSHLHHPINTKNKR